MLSGDLSGDRSDKLEESSSVVIAMVSTGGSTLSESDGCIAGISLFLDAMEIFLVVLLVLPPSVSPCSLGCG
jgi:hypothetical protein